MRLALSSFCGRATVVIVGTSPTGPVFEWRALGSRSTDDLWLVAALAVCLGGLIAALVRGWGDGAKAKAVAAFLVATAVAFFGYVGVTARRVDLVEAFSTPTGSSPGDANCQPSYPDLCIPAAGPDLDCTNAKVPPDIKVEGRDPHGFDGDRDGVGCESDPYQVVD